MNQKTVNRALSADQTLWVSLSDLLMMVALLLMSPAQAATFEKGDTILVAFPSTTIKDDAFITGLVTRVTEEGDYQIQVRDYVVGHDYGLSCEPIAVNAAGEVTDESGWELWENTKYLSTDGLQYIVPGENAMDLSVGKHYFIDRNNLHTRFSRWLSDAPVLSVEFLERAVTQAPALDLAPMIPAFEVAIAHRKSFYDAETGAPKWPHETLPQLERMLADIEQRLSEQPALRAHWFAEKRQWKQLEESMYLYFMIEALDKAVRDAEGALLDANKEKADPAVMQTMQQRLDRLYQRD
ncbi:hypothetical protein [Thiomicrospira sp. WB1]|uniref:hypothetical protein n=1 Tax=Thiomicrospira sp. WB1 TaxID=1685380 RepID=UPI00074727C9|nr:hypothetical protein [Thiomicrospira sp. WB1]KUJ72088.1 hypothetical protein AVO41_06540 [Thiomicrospira sp. WB1]